MTMEIAAAVVVGILATARLTRLWVADSFPPVAWLRTRYMLRASGDWADLASCAYCSAPWIALPILASGVASGLHPAWWLFCGWLAASYVTAWIVRLDAR